MPQVPLRTLSIYDKGSTYTIFDTDDKTHLYTIHFNSRSAPHMTVIRTSDTKSIVGSATYHSTKKLGFATASNITLELPSCETVSLNKEGGFFNNDKRTLRLQFWDKCIGVVGKLTILGKEAERRRAS